MRSVLIRTIGPMAVAAVLLMPALAQGQESTTKRSVAQHVIDKSATISIRNVYFDRVATKNKHRINVTTVNGVVLLVGEVPDAESKDLLNHVADTTEGVRQVVNEIRVGKVSSVGSLARNQWIKTKIKWAFSRQEDFPSSDIVVVVSNQVVYLMGLITQGEATRAAELAQTIKHVDRVVSIFEIKED